MSYAINQVLKYSNKQTIKVICDECNSEFDILYKSAERNRKRYGKHKCCKCTGVPLKPQNTISYWTKEKRDTLGKCIKSSEKYKIAISNRDNSGEKNPMYGRKATDDTKKLMSQKRKLRVGPLSPAWKGGGRCTVLQRVKGIIHHKYDWYRKVYKRDGWKCVKCDSKKQIDAHHIEPFNKIVKKLCENKTFENDDEKVFWLSEQPEIIDKDLKNGQTLCRECHKKEHANWGSHECR